ncbi:MAG: hypothetical protein RIC95_06140 [Vicingaceae bacterium]
MAQRISTEKKADGLLIKIKAYRDEDKQKLLTVWLGAWTLCGLAIISQLFTEVDRELKTLIIVFFAFWGYFEYLVVKAFRWRKSGEEQFFITEENLQYGRTYNNRGFLKPYRKDLINKLRTIDGETNTFVRVFSDSYWVIGGERLAFSAGGKVIPCGLRLTDKESKKLLKLVNQELEE